MLLLFSNAKSGESKNTLSIRRPQPHTTHPWKEEKENIVGDKKKEQIRPITKHWLCSFLPRSSQRDTERGTEVLRYWEILQRVSANECLWATKAPQVTRACTYGKGNALLKGCIGLPLILNSIHNTATDWRWVRLHFKTPLAKKIVWVK